MNSVWRWAWMEVAVPYNTSKTTQKDQNLKRGLSTQI